MEKTYLQEVGERLLKCKNRNFISRKELAKRAGISVYDVARMERGEETADIEKATKICKVLGYSLDFVLTGSGGLSEIVKMNQAILNLPDIYSKNLQKITKHFGLLVRNIFVKITSIYYYNLYDTKII